MARRIDFLERHHYLFRRLHSLSGIVPIGVFLVFHLITNSSVVWGMVNRRAGEGYFERGIGTFQEEVSWINELPALLIIEITLWVSIAFHAILGVYYAKTGRYNNAAYGFWDNWRYTLQRATGYIAIFYIFYHVATLRWGWTFLVPDGTAWEHGYASSTLAKSLRGGTDFTLAGVVISAFYFVGITASVFHFANGLWTAAITWGVTITEAAQRRWAWVCGVLGAGLMLMAWAALIGFAAMDPDEAYRVEKEIEQRTFGMHEQEAAAGGEGAAGAEGQ